MLFGSMDTPVPLDSIAPSQTLILEQTIKGDLSVQTSVGIAAAPAHQRLEYRCSIIVVTSDKVTRIQLNQLDIREPRKYWQIVRTEKRDVR